MDDDPELIHEQIQYYRARAPEYDETSSPTSGALAAHEEDIGRRLDEFAPRGRVLEIASGTGTWTRRLLRHASALTALDSSAEMHALSSKKLGNDPRVRYIEADIFSWTPDDIYDFVFFSNWLSHVPPTGFEGFWGIVASALARDGRVFFVDQVKNAWRNDDLQEEFDHDPSVPIVRRRLEDGRAFRVVKVFWDPDELETTLHRLGWDTKLHTAGPFYWGAGGRMAT